MLGVVIVVVGTVCFLALPRLGLVLARGGTPTHGSDLPWAAAALFVVSWVLPNPTWEGTNTFVQHAVGGGAACAVAVYWFAAHAGIRWWLPRALLAFAASASFGTVFELFELAYDEATGSRLGADTSWDLLANSTGAIVATVLLEAVALVRGARARRRLATEPSS